MEVKENDGSMKCPKCGSTEMLLTERRMDGDTICGACQHQGPTFTFKRSEAVASPKTDWQSRIEWLESENKALNKRIEAAAVTNQKREREVIGLKKQVVDLLVCISKLKAIKKELRNIIDCQSKELK